MPGQPLFPSTDSPTVGVLWDESHLWGLMLIRALNQLGFPFQLLSCSQIIHGALQGSDLQALIVPGGWSAKKGAGLGSAGLEAIRRFVYHGGGYLGFCGGAGFALTTGRQTDCLGLCPWTRKPVQNRLPNCSGHMLLKASTANRGPVCAPSEHILAPVWWPSQFEPRPGSNQPVVLASYAAPGKDFWVADLPLEKMGEEPLDEWEKRYNINLSPDILVEEPALISGRFGSGRYLLSYVHLETPSSPQANRWLKTILTDALGLRSVPGLAEEVRPWHLTSRRIFWDDDVLTRGRQALMTIVQAGVDRAFFSWRKPWLIGWKRGLPGFALNTLLAMIVEAQAREPSPEADELWRHRKEQFEGTLQEFRSLFLELLRTEAEQPGTPARSNHAADKTEVERLKERLVGPFPGQAGLFGQLSGDLQELLWIQLQHERPGHIQPEADQIR